jgi:hypothetical protein
MNKLVKIIAVIFSILLTFFAILDRIQLAEGGDLLSEKRIVLAVIFILGVLILLALVHIIEAIHNNKKSGS